MKKIKEPKKAEDAKNLDYSQRLVELETELRAYPARPAVERVLSSVHKPVEALVDKENVVQFQLGEKVYASGHHDATYADSNHSRGVRHIRFYAQGQVVLCIEGDFENQQFGSNFKFHYVEIYTPGAWETDFLKLTDDLRLHKEKRRNAFRKDRAREKSAQERRDARR